MLVMNSAKIGIYFGTNSGTIRLIAKKLAKKLGDERVDAPLNVNRASVSQFMSHDVLVLGTPTYGSGDLPSAAAGIQGGSWQEFLGQLEDRDFDGKRIAFYGLGDQGKYTNQFVNGLGKLWRFFVQRGAKTIGRWSTQGYTFAASEAVEGDTFCGLVLDNQSQSLLTDARLDEWARQLKTELGVV